MTGLTKSSAFALGVLLAMSCVLNAQQEPSGNVPAQPRPGGPAAPPPRVSLSPRFSPGQKFKYEMEFETTTATARSGLAADPQGPSQLVITWNATIRMEVLPPEPNSPGSLRLRTIYENSTANVSSDTFDPAAFSTQEQFRKLRGKVMEFTLDAKGKVISIAGLQEMVDGDQAVETAREWIAQLDAGSGAPPGGVSVRQKWSSEQPASSLPISGLVWRAESEYLRDEVCHPPNPQGAPAVADSAANPEPAEMCAVVLTHLDLVRPKPVRNPTPEEYKKSGVQSAGKWDGSGQGLTYISLRTGLVVSVTQSATEDMDVTLTTSHSTSMHYVGTVLSRSQVALVSDASDSE